MPGNVHPLINQAVTSVPEEPSTQLKHLVLHLQPSAAQEAELEQLIAEQSDQHSARYQKYLTPQEFAARFGVSSTDIATVSSWLQSHRLTVEQVPNGSRMILFSGTVDQVEETFKTGLRRYTMPNGERHLANATDPQIPAAFAGVVGGIVGLHDFQVHAQSLRSKPVNPQGIAPADYPGNARMLIPGDYYTIYDINPLLSAGIDGTGESVAVVARSNIYLSDVRSFRFSYGLKSNDPQIIITNTDPGVASGSNASDAVEATLDTEWAGAVAPGATVKLIVSSTTSSGDGVDLSSAYAVTNNVAPIISVSYAGCESTLGATRLAFYNSLWKQAAAQGQTVLVASGDAGAAGCDLPTSATATKGKAVNGICSSPYATCVGGTEFVEGSNEGQYWLPLDPTGVLTTAISYIPETVWNESGANNGVTTLAAGGGGVSTVYGKPAWQTGPGVPADGFRDVPDVSLTAGEHDAYTVVQGGSIGYVFGMSGTSCAAPSFAAMMALVDQQTKSRQGNINPILYALAAKQSNGADPVFHDVTTGNNSVPGQAGFSATTGYDPASGLGSVDANLLATLWNTATTTPLALTIYADQVSMAQGQAASTSVTTVANGLKSAVSVSISNVPAGITATLSSSAIASPGSGAVTLKIVANSSVKPGVYPITLTATAGSQTAKSTVDVEIIHPTFTLSYADPQIDFNGPPFAPQTFVLETLPTSGFSAPITFTATGMPSGMSINFSPASVSGSAPASTTVTVSATSAVHGGSYSVTFTATGGGITQTVVYDVVVMIQPSCILTPNQTAISFKAGASGTFTLTCPSLKAATTPVTLSLQSSSAISAKLSANTITPGGSVTLSVTSAATTTPGFYGIGINATETDGALQIVSLTVAVSKPIFALSVSPANLVAAPGSTAQLTAVVAPDPGLTTPVNVQVANAPNGVTTSVASSSAASHTSTISLTIPKTLATGTISSWCKAASLASLKPCPYR